jgi:hypothetical protein
MRFPNTPFMKRTFELVNYINKSSPGKLKWIKYAFKSDNTFTYYNGVRLTTSSSDLTASDPYRINAYTPHYIPDPYVDLLCPTTLQQTLETIMQRLKADFKTMHIDAAMKKLIRTYDKHSMRSYLTFSADYQYPSEVIDLLEVFDKSTGWYDRALVETVCESLAFQWLGSSDALPDYYCLE